MNFFRSCSFVHLFSILSLIVLPNPWQVAWHFNPFVFELVIQNNLILAWPGLYLTVLNITIFFQSFHLSIFAIACLSLFIFKIFEFEFSPHARMIIVSPAGRRVGSLPYRSRAPSVGSFGAETSKVITNENKQWSQTQKLKKSKRKYNFSLLLRHLIDGSAVAFKDQT